MANGAVQMKKTVISVIMSVTLIISGNCGQVFQIYRK